MITRMSRINWNKGVVQESNTPYDYTRCEIEIDIFDNSANEFGVGTLVCELGTEEMHKQFLHLRGVLPAIVNIEFIPVKKGSNILNQVTKLDVIETCRIDYSIYEAKYQAMLAEREKQSQKQQSKLQVQPA